MASVGQYWMISHFQPGLGYHMAPHQSIPVCCGFSVDPENSFIANAGLPDGLSKSGYLCG